MSEMNQQQVRLPTYEAMYAFLSDLYLHSRFAGRDGPVWGADYSSVITRSALTDLEERGVGFIGPFECRMGRVIKYSRDLAILNPDEPPAQIQRVPGHLTHIYGA
jgi:hypothetical protein